MSEESNIKLRQQYYVCEIHGDVTEIWSMRESIWCGQCWGELMDKTCKRVSKGEYR